MFLVAKATLEIADHGQWVSLFNFIIMMSYRRVRLHYYDITLA